MRVWTICAAALLMLGNVTWSYGQFPEPGKEHEFLKQSEGEWDIKMDAGGTATSMGSAKYKMAMGGLWLVSDVEMDMQGTKFTGHGLDSYDPAKKKYVGVWVDSMTTSPIVIEGELSADMKTLTMSGKGPGQDGKTTDYKMITEYKDKNTHIFKMWSGSLTGDPMMTLTYVRKK
jgi:Protein of unknown function (DUF1579)